MGISHIQIHKCGDLGAERIVLESSYKAKKEHQYQTCSASRFQCKFRMFPLGSRPFSAFFRTSVLIDADSTDIPSRPNEVQFNFGRQPGMQSSHSLIENHLSHDVKGQHQLYPFRFQYPQGCLTKFYNPDLGVTMNSNMKLLDPLKLSYIRTLSILNFKLNSRILTKIQQGSYLRELAVLS